MGTAVAFQDAIALLSSIAALDLYHQQVYWTGAG
jgi:hypothetical protein